ncbi:MAG TPA: redoxin domain-containing protein [Planctomycetes bacterium]|nr:redoxin domain-containing protein [Planctomycetota bacterium]
MGASFNSPGKNASWVESQSFEYEVWNDTDKALAIYYGSVKSDLAFLPGRVTMILDEDGKLIEVQGAAEKQPFAIEQFHEMVAIGQKSCLGINALQRAALGL